MRVLVLTICVALTRIETFYLTLIHECAKHAVHSDTSVSTLEIKLSRANLYVLITLMN